MTPSNRIGPIVLSLPHPRFWARAESLFFTPQWACRAHVTERPPPRTYQIPNYQANSVRRGQKVPLQRVTFFYRACAGFAWWVSQRTPAGQIWVVRPVAVGHRRYARWGMASAAWALSPSPLGPPPKPSAGCAGEPRREAVLARVSRARSRHMRHTLQRPARTSQRSRF